jgi:NhaA family Na+:H+ antiporter
MFNSGIHPTIAGVLLGLLTPAKPILPKTALVDELTAVVSNPEVDEPRHHGSTHHVQSVSRLKKVAAETVSPLERLETALHPWVAFVIMPIFALANAGVEVDVAALVHPIAWSVAAGLTLGKPLGVFLFSWLAVQLGIASLPAGVDWKALAGAGCLAGIGFTMSLFIASLALEGDLLSAGKIGAILGSAVSAVLGVLALISFLPAQPQWPSEG